MNKDLKKLLAKLESQGWRIQEHKGHYKLFPPDPEATEFVTLAGTPSDHRAWKNNIARLRRLGADI